MIRKPAQKAKIDDVARAAGVSIKTVSRVVNREPNVREGTRDRVNNAIRKLNYRPSQSARNLASRRAKLIALIYEDPSFYDRPSSGYIVRLQQGALRACHGANYELLIHPCQKLSRDVSSGLASFIDQFRPTGVIIAAPLSNSAKIIKIIEASGTPFVRMSTGTRARKHTTVSTNDVEFCADMVSHLHELGHRRIAFVSGAPRHKAVALRSKGFSEGMARHKLRIDKKLLFEGDNSIGSGEMAAQHLLSLKQRPTAIFAANDDMAAGVLRIAAKLGVRVPEELSVAGCDDNALAQNLYPALTTIRQPLAAMSQWAAQKLIDNSGDAESELEHSIIPASLQLRESTGTVPK